MDDAAGGLTIAASAVRQLLARGRRGALISRVTIAVAIVLAAASVLWAHQTRCPSAAPPSCRRALLTADSYLGAVWEVFVFATPSLVLYVLASRSIASIVGWGLVIATTTVWVWWQAATDWHSTASLGPGFLGWMLLPMAIAVVSLMARIHRNRPATRS